MKVEMYINEKKVEPESLRGIALDNDALIKKTIQRAVNRMNRESF